MKSEQELIVSLITNTQRSSGGRNKSVYEIAEDIRSLIAIKGSVKDVAQIANISPNMLNKFLSVFKLDSKLIPLVISRKLDSVESIYSISKYAPDIQYRLATYIINDSISSQDIRALSPYIKQHPNEDVKVILDKLIASKNIKISVVKFPIKADFDTTKFENAIGKLLSPENIIGFEYESGIGAIKITKPGEQELRTAAKGQNVSLSDLIKNLIIS